MTWRRKLHKISPDTGIGLDPRAWQPLIEEIHAEVDEFRRRRGLPPWNWKKIKPPRVWTRRKKKKLKAMKVSA